MTDSDLANSMQTENLSLSELRKLFGKYFDLGHINGSLNDKFTLITLTGYLEKQLSKKDPTITCYRILKKIVGDDFDDKTLKGISITIESFTYDTEPSNLGLSNKEVVDKIKNLMEEWMPF